MLKMRYLIVLILLINSAFAQNAVSLNKDQKAPFEGVLLTKERAEKAVKAEKRQIVLEDLRISQEELIKYHRKDAALQRRKLSQAKFESHVYNIAYFLLGVVITGYAFKIQEDIRR